MAELYREHRFFQHRGDALLLRVCFERLSDGKYAVCQTEFIRDADDLTMRLAEIAVASTELLLDPELPSLWTFHDSLADAIGRHDGEFADFESWTSNAPN